MSSFIVLSSVKPVEPEIHENSTAPDLVTSYHVCFQILSQQRFHNKTMFSRLANPGFFAAMRQSKNHQNHGINFDLSRHIA
jgi:hypothetical protein